MKKSITFLSALLFSLSSIFALPGFSPAIPDTSGEFVYYKDTTFQRESYIGFLVYNQETYCARYFSPEDKTKNLKEKSITIYFTINPDSPYMELTGEKIDGTYTAEDTEYINYIHDMIYELNARRIKAGNISLKSFSHKYSSSKNKNSFMEEYGTIVHDEFMQFGGSVTEIFHPLIPLFNLKKIVDSNQNDVFYAVSIGAINNSTDDAFFNFKGFQNQQEDFHSFSPKTDAKPKKISSNFQTITVTDQWQTLLENMLSKTNDFQPSEQDKLVFSKTAFLNDSAFLTLDESMAFNKENENVYGIPIIAIRKYFYEASSNSNLSSLNIDFSKKGFSINYTRQAALNGKNHDLYTNYTINKTSENVYTLKLVACKNTLMQNMDYFKKILSSINYK